MRESPKRNGVINFECLRNPYGHIWLCHVAAKHYYDKKIGPQQLERPVSLSPDRVWILIKP